MMVNIKIPEPKQTEQLPALVKLLIEKQDPEFQKRVLGIAKQYEVNVNDPMFVVLMATGQLQALLEDKPKQLNQLFEEWSKDIYEHVELTKRTSLKKLEVEIAHCVSKLIAQSERKQTWRFSIVLPSFGIFTAILCCGILLGMAVPEQVENAQLLQWAKSPEGQLARNIVTWNAKSLNNLNCTRKSKRSDYCLLRVKDSSQKR